MSPVEWEAKGCYKQNKKEPVLTNTFSNETVQYASQLLKTKKFETAFNNCTSAAKGNGIDVIGIGIKVINIYTNIYSHWLKLKFQTKLWTFTLVE